MNYKKAKDYAFERLRTELPDNLYYHGFHHTIDVLEAAVHLGTMEKISDEEEVLLKTAAAFHDIGFIKQYQKNEPLAAEIAREALPHYDYNEDQIDIVCGCILATEIPQSPKSHLERILCDADLDYLGRDDFFMIAQTLRSEWVKNQIFTESLKEWYHLQYKFLNNHSYHTDSGLILRHERKLQHLNEIKQLIGFEE